MTVQTGRLFAQAFPPGQPCVILVKQKGRTDRGTVVGLEGEPGSYVLRAHIEAEETAETGRRALSESRTYVVGELLSEPTTRGNDITHDFEECLTTVTHQQ